jgi:hypothetical protein
MQKEYDGLEFPGNQEGQGFYMAHVPALGATCECKACQDAYDKRIAALYRQSAETFTLRKFGFPDPFNKLNPN